MKSPVAGLASVNVLQSNSELRISFVQRNPARPDADQCLCLEGLS